MTGPVGGDDDLRWAAVGSAADWPANGGRLVTIGARRIGVYHHDGGWYALKDVCPHAGISLSKGPVAEKAVMCVGHGWRSAIAPVGCHCAQGAIRHLPDV